MNRKEQIDKATPMYEKYLYSEVDNIDIPLGYGDEGKQKAFREGARWADEHPHWHKTSEEMPEFGVEVIAYHEKWIDEDFNPNGTRVGFIQDDGFTSANWNNEQDCYDTCSIEGDDYYQGVSGIPGMDEYHKQFAKPNMPTHWMPIPKHP
ncbi:DUF551 domain-containing protein [Prevotella sp.]|uniref:DUF551 domain-containing protein n=1 Tax=Prevotella sp. TaxID=59823 RepID=UPI002ABE324C|nr:DUF551 domain-containing protein [Prevotella sp.]